MYALHLCLLFFLCYYAMCRICRESGRIPALPYMYPNSTCIFKNNYRQKLKQKRTVKCALLELVLILRGAYTKVTERLGKSFFFADEFQF